MTLHKKKFSIEDFFSKRDQIHRKLRIWSHLLKTFLMENSIFCAEIVKADEGLRLSTLLHVQSQQKKLWFIYWSSQSLLQI